MVSPYRAEHATTPKAERSALHWYTAELSHALKAQSYDVNVIAPGGARALPWADRGIRVLPSYRRGHALAPAQILAAVLMTRGDVIHVQHELFAYGGIATAFALPCVMRHFRRPVVTTIHGVIPLDRIDRNFLKANAFRAPAKVVRASWRQLIRNIVARTDVVHVHEAEHAEWLRVQYGVSKRIEVEPLGTSAGELPISGSAREALSIPVTANVLLFFGYLLARKGIVPFLESVAALLAADPRLIVIVAGDVPERVAGASDIMGHIEALRRHPRFRYLGFIADGDIGTVFAAADVVIFPYTFSMSASGSLSQAFAARRPVLLSSVFRAAYPNAPSFFEPTVTGISKIVASFFSDGSVRERAEAFGREFGEVRTWSQMAKRMVNIYESVSEDR